MSISLGEGKYLLGLGLLASVSSVSLPRKWLRRCEAPEPFS
jgi:hypothetical protein